MNAPIKTIDVFGIGVAVLDVLMVVETLPVEESVVRADDRRIGLGGGVAVAMATAAMMGGRTALADRLGNDIGSLSILSHLRDASVFCDGLEITDDQRASIATVWVCRPSGSRTIVFSPGSDRELSWTEELATTVASSRVFHCNGRHLESCLQAVDVAKKNDTIISFDGGAHRYRDEVLPLVEASEVLIVSQHFAAAHHQRHSRSDPNLGATALVDSLASDFGAGLIGVTAGERGSWFATRDGDRWHEPAVCADRVVDTTGCGDTFHGAFLLGVANGYPFRRCSRLAAAVAGKNAAGLGALAIDRPSLAAIHRQDSGR
ncbi:putative sugar kinase YdjH [Rubripirellula tenax]|uniref:Putative sugar kinase YdjH n=1 Tax=Rubripirellula tenax TaxID=2528015 RepID=A0A5C6F7P4_9BACT|nr:carbohydrate kinase family protein [Rubripirellula tenax]TWU56992.1 putative sugar kinase YdjH [Rubripirellula tenax]